MDPIEEPEQVCVDISAEGSAEKLAYLVKFAMAQAVKSIMQQTAVGEYGIAAYVHNGELKTMPLVPPPAGTFTSRIEWDLIPSGSAVIGFLHSHPRMNWSPNRDANGQPFVIDYSTTADPGYLLRPGGTRMEGGMLLGDWLTYDWAVLEYDNPDMLMFIAGAMPGSDDLHLNAYGSSDHGYASGGTNPSTGDLGRSPLDLEIAPPCSEN